ncbi:integrase family protein [Granulicella tundricola MP5ACTX9]|uniref:Integrase family protein n=2 Tax=Granulicella TaxID=940557 RepID=E8X186_GRATM|nr:integrase family protein [Granulicella tundricola MP5ACTX9]
MLLQLCQYLGPVALAAVTAKDVLGFLDGQSIGSRTWRLKHQMLSRFFEFWSARAVLPGLRMPPQRPEVRQTFEPYIYSRAEIQSLLRAARTDHHPTRLVDPQTLRTFILFLYGTGALTGEILGVKDADVDLETGMLTIVSARWNRSRSIPLSRDLCEVLQKYRNWRARKRLFDPHFLVTKNDKPLSKKSVVVCFARLRRIAGVCRRDGSALEPRLNDLKFTFAVHRITSWIRNGANLSRMLPALAAYMGQVDLGATERYLSMTPERFRKELNRLSPRKGKAHWRDKPELMKFVSSL